MSGTVKITFIGDSSNLKKSLSEINRQVGGTESSFSKLQNRFSAARGPALAFTAAIGAATAGIAYFGFSSVKAYQESEEASKKLSTNLLNVKGNTDKNVTSIKKLAAALQKKGVIEDDAIIAGASQLATFNLQGKTIEKLTPKIADMVAQIKGHNATAEDMVKVNNLIGKVMTGNVGALSKYGVTLNKNQKLQIKNGTEAEKAAAIVEVLGQNYGKVNEALRKTPQGRITALKNRFGDLKETIGEFIALKIFEPITKALDGFLDNIDKAGGPLKALKGFAEDNSAAFSAFAGVVGVMLVLAFGALGVSIWSALAPLLPFIAAGAALGLVADQIAKSMGGWNKVFEKLQPHLKDTWESIKLFIEGDFSKGLFGFDENHGLVRFLKSVREGWDAIVLAIKMYVIPIFRDAWKIVTDELAPALEKLGLDSALLKDIFIALAVVLAAVVVGALVVVAATVWVVVEAVTLLAKGIGYLVDAWSWLVEGLGGAKLIFSALGDAIKIIFWPITALIDSIQAAIDKWDAFYNAIKKVGDIIGKIGGAIGGAGKSIGGFFNGTMGSAWGNTSGLALGGPAQAGMPYKVGEGGGPEMFIPSTDGHIVNARQTRSMGSTYNVNVYPQKAEFSDRDLLTTLKRFESLHAA